MPYNNSLPFSLSLSILSLSLLTHCAQFQSTVINTSQYHSVPQGYYLEERIAAVVLPSGGKNLSAVSANFSIWIQNSNYTNYTFNLLIIPSSAPQSLNAYKCFVRAATEGFEDQICPFTELSVVNGSCQSCFDQAFQLSKQTTACIGCTNASELIELYIEFNKTNTCFEESQLNCNTNDTDFLLIIDNTGVMAKPGEVYLEMMITYIVELKLYENDETFVLLWIVLICVFILITGVMITYLCCKIKRLKEKIKAQQKQE